MEKRITIPEAADLAGVSKQSIWLWCKLYDIGEKVGRDWLVDVVKLKNHMKKRAR